MSTDPLQQLPVDPGDSSTWPIFDDLTPEQAKAAPSESGFGLTLDGMSAWWPGINCMHCARFVSRAGYVSVGHFESSHEIAYVEGDCLKCDAGGTR